MIINLLAIYQKVNFKLNLFELLMGLVIFVLIKLIVRKIVRTIRNDSSIDERMRERRSRIARVAAEIDYSAISKLKSNDNSELDYNKETDTSHTFGEPFIGINETSEMQTTNETQLSIVDKSKQVDDYYSKETPNIEQKSNSPEISSESQKKKKTRAMSMEERWADFDRKRNTDKSDV